MALLDFLKKKQKTEKKPAKKVEKASVAKKVEKTTVEPQKTEKRKPNIKGFSYELVKEPHISEKATYLSEKDQYVFEVMPNSNKKQIKDSVEGIYCVDVLSVNIIKIPSKKRRLGRTEGFRKAYKKAVVKIKSGQKIEIL